jgi:hypothetical protein
MKNHLALKIFPLSSPVMFTELLAVMGDKYKRALPFQWEICRDFSSANVVFWDGVKTIKNQKIVQKVLENFSSRKILLLVDGSSTLFENRSSVKVLGVENVSCIQVRGWNVLPEELLTALKACHKKLEHV